MKKLLMLIVMLLTVFSFVELAYGQSAKDAIKALKKIEARTETGITKKDYSAALADTKVEVNLFLESKAGKKNPQLTDHIKKALYLFEIANTIWGEKFTPYATRYEQIGAVAVDSDYGKLIRKLYPKARTSKPGEYIVDIVLSDIWADASKEIKMLVNYLE
jgi:hypothetical protein